jgi:hypothetical protein
VKNNVPFVLAGSIRDDGPLPDVITDTMKAQDMMREQLKDADIVLMMATMLHSIAVGNCLPSSVSTICIDINPSTVTKLMTGEAHRRLASSRTWGHSCRGSQKNSWQ